MHKTIEELGFKAGDKVRCTEVDLGFSNLYNVGEVYTVTLWEGTIPVVDKGMNGYSANWELVIDMTENEKPFGLLSEAGQKILEDAGTKNCERFDLDGNWVDMGVCFGFSKSSTYRLKKQPPRVKVSDLEGTVEMKDGKPDWDSYTE